MPQRTECKHVLKDSAFNSLQDRICLQNSLGVGGANPFSAIRLLLHRLFLDHDIIFLFLDIEFKKNLS